MQHRKRKEKCAKKIRNRNKGNDIVAVCNKDEIEWRTTHHNKEHFSKVKSTKACDYKTNDAMKENNTRDAIMKGKLNRNECNDNDACQFLHLLKNRKG